VHSWNEGWHKILPRCFIIKGKFNANYFKWVLYGGMIKPSCGTTITTTCWLMNWCVAIAIHVAIGPSYEVAAHVHAGYVIRERIIEFNVKSMGG